MIEAIELSKRYADGTLALDSLHFEINAGEIYCLLGAPGAGKTTVINIFLGFTAPTAGKALVNGIDVASNPLEAKRYLAFLDDNISLYGNLTAMQNLEFFSRLGSGKSYSREEYAMAMREVGLPERSFHQRIEKFDKGMRQKLGVAIALVKDTPALFFDEPMAGLDAQTTAELAEILENLKIRGKAILLSTQNLFHAKQLADTVGILKEGRNVLSCGREELRYQDLESLYLSYMRGEKELTGRTSSLLVD